MSTDDDRPRGVLAPVDRQFLRGEKTYSYRQSAYDRRQKIQERVRNGLLDFSVLFHHQNDDDRGAIFERSEREQLIDMVDDPGHALHGAGSLPERDIRDHIIDDGMCDAIAYFYLGILDRGYEKENFARLIERGVERAVERQAGGEKIATVTTSIDIEFLETTHEELFERYREGDELSPDEARALVEAYPEVAVEAIASGFESAEE